MRRTALFLLISALAIAPASAEIVKLSSSPSVGDLRGACSRAGGNFQIHIDGGGYGCTVSNCDGEGGSCTVACDNNSNCYGDTPARLQPGRTLFGILQNGDNVFHNPGTGNTQSLVDSGPGADHPPEPVNEARPASPPSLL